MLVDVFCWYCRNLWPWAVNQITAIPTKYIYWCSIVTMAISSVVCEIFSVEKYRDLEIRVGGHSSSLKMVPFDRLGMISYWCSIVTLSLRRPVSVLGVKKLESWGYRAEKKVWRYLQLSGYNTPTWRIDRRMDRQTDRHRATAKTALTHSVAR